MAIPLHRTLTYINIADFSRELSQRDIKEVCTRGHAKRLRPGEAVFIAGDPATSVCLVLGGLLGLIRSQEEGRELIVALMRRGEVFGVQGLLGHFPELDTARALTACEVCCFTPEEFRRLVTARPHLAFTVIKSLAGKVTMLKNRVEALAFKSLPARLADLLLQFAWTFGKRVGHGIHLAIPLTQQNLADLVAASRQHVNYVLADFRARRLIQGKGPSLTLINVEELKTIAQGYSIATSARRT